MLSPVKRAFFPVSGALREECFKIVQTMGEYSYEGALAF